MFVSIKYLKDLVDSILVCRQAGKGVGTETLGKSCKWQETLCVDLKGKKGKRERGVRDKEGKQE